MEDWLKLQAKKNPQGKFLNELTFLEVEELVVNLVNPLSSLVSNEDRVALYAKNTVETVLLLFALFALEKEVLMLNTRLTEDEILEKLRRLKISKVFTPDESISFKTSKSLPKFISYQEVLNSKIKDDFHLPQLNKYNLEKNAIIMDTSATSGEYKSVPLRWQELLNHVQASQKVLGVTDEDNWLLVIPLCHIGGLAILLRSLYNGTRVTLLDKFDEERVLTLIENNKVNMLSLVPTMLKRIIHGIHNHALRVLLLSGEYIPNSLVEECLAKKIPIYKSYGMTETTSQVTTFCVKSIPQKLESVGRPLPGMQIKINQPDQEGIGEILLQGPMLMKGYLGQMPLEGFFNTQDIGYLDEDGYLYILDRRQNLIISGGENIYPQEIEKVLSSHPDVQECALVGKKDEKWGQIPVLFLVSNLREEEVMEYLSEQLAKYKLPKKIVYLEELPKNSTGKIMRKALTEKSK